MKQAITPAFLCSKDLYHHQKVETKENNLSEIADNIRKEKGNIIIKPARPPPLTTSLDAKNPSSYMSGSILALPLAQRFFIPSLRLEHPLLTPSSLT